MPVPVGLDAGRNDPRSPYYEEPEDPQEYEDRMYEQAEAEREQRIIEEAKAATEGDE